MPETAVDVTPPPAALPPRPAPSAFQPYSGARKLVIKNLRAPSPHVDAYYARTEAELDGALAAVLAGRRPAVPLERLYRGVEDMCRRGSADKVYAMLTGRVQAHLRAVVLPRVARARAASNLDVLRSLLAEWKTWNAQAVRLPRRRPG